MKLIIALANPGNKYKNTRHNLGKIILEDYLKEKYQQQLSLKKKLLANIFETGQGSQKTIFAVPDQYMNNSGISVKKLIDFYKVKLENLYIIHDDLDLPLGNYRIQSNRGSAGHNGIKSIIQELKSQNFNRIRLGINNNQNIPSEDYVLQSFSTTELKIIKKLLPEIFTEIDNI